MTSRETPSSSPADTVEPDAGAKGHGVNARTRADALETDAVPATPAMDAAAPHAAHAPAEAPTPPADAPPAASTEPESSDEDVPLTHVHNPWRERFAHRLWITDLLVLVWVVYGTQIFWFGWGRDALGFDIPLETSAYTALSLAVILVWMAALALIDSRSDRVIGYGMGEYVKVADASLRVFGGIAIVAFLLRIDVARGYLLIALPSGIVFLVLARWIWRQWLIAQREMGQYTAKVLLVGSRASVAHIAARAASLPAGGLPRGRRVCADGQGGRGHRGHRHPDHGQRRRRRARRARDGRRHRRDHEHRRSAAQQGQGDLVGASRPASSTSSWRRASTTSRARVSTRAPSRASPSSTWRRRGSAPASGSSKRSFDLVRLGRH